MAHKREGKKESGRYAYIGLDRVLHEKARLGILTSLASRPDGLLFHDLKELCSLTDGNLSRHLQTLEEAGLVEVWKGFRNRRPQTLCRLSKEGQARFLEYLSELEQVVKDAAAIREFADKGTESGGTKVREDWVPA
jgi:DNA-binding MarR family transcriptional regulator